MAKKHIQQITLFFEGTAQDAERLRLWLEEKLSDENRPGSGDLYVINTGQRDGNQMSAFQT